MLPDRVSNPGPLTYESGVLPIALRGPAQQSASLIKTCKLGKILEKLEKQCSGPLSKLFTIFYF